MMDLVKQNDEQARHDFFESIVRSFEKEVTTDDQFIKLLNQSSAFSEWLLENHPSFFSEN